MERKVFYSWQSDLPNNTNRSFIEAALEAAAKDITTDESVSIEPVIDRDTLGAAGAPNISTTILAKIIESNLFVADISFIGKVGKRSMPNPNVLIELGYALHAKGSEALILVLNTDYGKVEDLPFDLKMRRILTYTTKGDKPKARAALAKDLRAALLAGFSNSETYTERALITDIVRQNPPDKIIALREHLAKLLGELDDLQPIMHRDGGTADDLIKGIDSTKLVALSFAELAETVALMNDVKSAKEIFAWFGKILARYYPPANASGRISDADGDFFKFVGNELFTMFVAPFVRENKWSQLQEILSETLKVPPHRDKINSTREGWHDLSGYMRLLADESKRLNRKSKQYDLLEERHSSGPLSKISPLIEYQDADFLLFLQGPETNQDGEYIFYWYPRSILLAQHTPEFITEARDYSYATQLCRTLQINSIEELKKRLLASRKVHLYDLHSPISEEDISSIGSVGGGKVIS